MNFVKSISDKVLKKIAVYLPESTPQDKVDVYRAALVLKCFTVCNNSSTREPTQADIDLFCNEVNNMEYNNKLSSYVQKEVNRQMVDMFLNLDKLTLLKETSKRKIVNEVEFLLQEQKFALECKSSSIPNAGDGVFVKAARNIVPGSVVGIYPGKVHLREFLREKNYFESLLPDPNLMIMARLDESIIDGRTANDVPYNPYALAHKVNHCGENKMPNVIQISFDFPASDWLTGGGFPIDLRKHIPNIYAKKPSLIGRMDLSTTTCMKTVVLLAARHLQDGDELLMDYRLNPDSKQLPAWYTSYDAEDAKVRWGTTTTEATTVEKDNNIKVEDSQKANVSTTNTTSN